MLLSQLTLFNDDINFLSYYRGFIIKIFYYKYYMTTVNIYGAGISGLTVAHELIEKGFKVNVFEKDSEVGGMAKSKRNKYNIPTEHSWRGYAPFYHNTFDILKRIPIDNDCMIEEMSNHDDRLLTYRIKNGKYEFWDLTDFINKHPGGKNKLMRIKNKNLDDVIPGWHKLFINKKLKQVGIKLPSNNYFYHKDKKKILKKENFRNYTTFDNLNRNRLDFELLYNQSTNNKCLTLKDKIYLGYKFLKVGTSDLRMKKYFKTRMIDFIKKESLSDYGYKYIFDFIAGPGYGFDKNSMSIGHYGLFIEYVFSQSEKKWQVMNQPTSEAWLNPWFKFLKDKGVKFYFNHTLLQVNHSHNKINHCLIKNKNEIKKLVADVHIVAINPNNLPDIFKKSNLIKLSDQHFNLSVYNNQISFRLGLNKKINFDKNNKGFVLVDSPFNITFYPQEDHWCKNVNLGLNEKIKSLWSGTIILSYIPGYLYKKSALSHNLDELKKEIIEQFIRSQELIEMVKKNNNNLTLKRDDFIYQEIYDDWIYNENRLESKNKKWVNDSDNEEFRPESKTNLDNLFLTGSHCKTKVNIWSMESAVESGKICSNEVLKKYNKEKIKIYYPKTNPLLCLLKNVDNILYSLNLPNIIDIIIVIFVIYLIKYIYQRYNVKKY
jgi:uncharacterized protein with NAD-binding domain and iron-sulfur cluster